MTSRGAGTATRVAAARALAAVRFGGESLKSALPRYRDPLPDPRDRALCEAIVFAGCRWLPRFERVLDRLLQRPLPTAARDVHGLLLAGLAQLDALGMPAYAALDATAEAARTLRQPHLVGLVNAVLRRFLRERAELDIELADDPAYLHAHPDWLLQRLQAAWPDDWPRIVAANNTEAPLWLRVNRRRGARDAYSRRLQDAGIATDTADGLDDALRLAASQAIGSLPGWDDGLVSIQDGAAQMCARALDAQPGDEVLDACAAPGGKAAHLLESVDGLRLLAVDSDASRLRRVGQTLSRLGLEADLLAADAGAPTDWAADRRFDRLLLDAPCSATGVIRRQPDIRWHRRDSDIDALVAQQRRLLDGVWPLLRPGGRLVYATCSVLPDENARQIDAFLDRHADAQALDLGDAFGRRAGAGRQRLPGELGMDGFFYSAIGKPA